MSSVDHEPAQSELLCFINQKRNTMAVDDIAKMCTDFFCENEILAIMLYFLAAKALLEQVLTERLKTRDWKTRDWKTRDQNAGVENAGLENAGPSNGAGKRRTGKRETT